MDKHLHIITHDVPWPADYGGVVDLFYKLKALHQAGVKIHLHCFTQGREPQVELEKYCEEVSYYPRNRNLKGFSFRIPFIVNSRKSQLLLANLKKDNFPILIEGIHCSYYLYKELLNDRKCILRLHNTECKYYQQLARNESNWFKRWYYIWESKLLKKYEHSIANKVSILSVSEQDTALYKSVLGAKDIQTMPVFIPHQLALGKEGKGLFCLYHGNLSINENEKAALWLLQKVFNQINTPLVIAGKNPSPLLEKWAHRQSNTCLVANPSQQEMQDLIAKAQIHILPSFNQTGVKLKLINAVFNGRHCLVNEQGVAGSGLDTTCIIAETAEAFQDKILLYYEQPFSENEIEKRNGLLHRLYNNKANAAALIAMFWSEKNNK